MGKNNKGVRVDSTQFKPKELEGQSTVATYPSKIADQSILSPQDTARQRPTPPGWEILQPCDSKACPEDAQVLI